MWNVRDRMLTKRKDAFDQFFNDPLIAFNGFFNEKSMTNLYESTIVETDGGYSIQLIAPGLKRSSFDVSVERDSYNTYIKATISDDKTQLYTKTWVAQRQVLESEISAKYDAGILYITVPVPKKPESTKTFKVEIK